jgi:hypothetical protein
VPDEKEDPRYAALLEEVEQLKTELANVRVVERMVIVRINGLIDMLKWLRKHLRSALDRSAPKQKPDDPDGDSKPD